METRGAGQTPPQVNHTLRGRGHLLGRGLAGAVRRLLLQLQRRQQSFSGAVFILKDRDVSVFR